MSNHFISAMRDSAWESEYLASTYPESYGAAESGYASNAGQSGYASNAGQSGYASHAAESGYASEAAGAQPASAWAGTGDWNVDEAGDWDDGLNDTAPEPQTKRKKKKQSKKKESNTMLIVGAVCVGLVVIGLVCFAVWWLIFRDRKTPNEGQNSSNEFLEPRPNQGKNGPGVGNLDGVTDQSDLGSAVSDTNNQLQSTQCPHGLNCIDFLRDGKCCNKHTYDEITAMSEKREKQKIPCPHAAAGHDCPDFDEDETKNMCGFLHTPELIENIRKARQGSEAAANGSAKPETTNNGNAKTTPKSETECRYGVECRTKDCPYKHSQGRKVDQQQKEHTPKNQTECRHGVGCRTQDCTYKHSQGRKVDQQQKEHTPKNQTECRYGVECRTKDCPYKHSQGRKIDQPKEKPEDKPKGKPMCKHKGECRFKNCTYGHPEGHDWRKNVDCQWGDKCRNKHKGCPYKH